MAMGVLVEIMSILKDYDAGLIGRDELPELAREIIARHEEA